MAATVKIGTLEVHLPTSILALAAGTAGGLAARALGLPLPMLLGSLLVIASAALLGFRPFGRVLALPMPIRTAFIPVIGVSIGAAFTPDILEDLGRWWPTLLALVLYIPAAHAMAYAIAIRAGGIDKPTAYYGTMPGGFIESMTLGEEAGADAAMLAVLQFLRLILCIVFIPIGFSLATGHAVGSASGAVIGGGSHVLTATDWLILFLSGLVGAVGARKLRLPAGIITGPILVSGAVHLLGWVEGAPPRLLIDITQLVVGTTLGARFAGRSPRILLTGFRLSAVNIALTLILALGFSLSMHGLVGERWEAVFLAFAPGGLAEMALIALSLEISVIYVTAHHVARIILAVTLAKAFAGRVLR